MSFFDRIFKNKKDKNDRAERESIEEVQAKAIVEAEQKKVAEEAAQKAEAERLEAIKLKQEAEAKAREEAAIKLQKEIAEANRQAAEESARKEALKTSLISNSNQTTYSQQTSPEPSKVVSNLIYEKEEDAVEKYIDSKTGKVYYIKKGSAVPVGAVKSSEYSPLGSYNSASNSISLAKAREGKGKEALAPSTGFVNTGGFAISSKKDSDITGDVMNSKSPLPTALSKSTKGLDWQNAAGTGGFAQSAARIEYSTAVDYEKLTDADKAIIAKEQQWKNMTETERILARETLPDKDGDLVPDLYDCVPDDYTKQGYADIYLGGKYALGPSNKMQRNVVSGKGRLQMATSLQGPKDVIGAIVSDAKVGNILDFSSKGSSIGGNPAMAAKISSNVNFNNISKKMFSNNQNNTIVKSKSNKMFKVDMSKTMKNTFNVDVFNKQKYGKKTASKVNMDKSTADKVFKNMSKRFF